MNPEVLEQIKKINRDCIERFEGDFQLFPIDTSFGETKDDPKRTAEVVVNTILGLIEEQISEDILSCRKEAVIEAFSEKNFIDGSRALGLVSQFRDYTDDDFRPRDEVEKYSSRVQALPIVIVRNASGDVLRLCRREKRSDNPLHEKTVIWAGGHVRREDAVNGDPLTFCAVREIEEELRLQIESSALQLLGAVYFDNGGSTSRHVAIAYEWRAATDDVSVVLSRTEFFERRGTSLSGSFASVDKLAEDVEKGKMKEPWSVELIREYLARSAFDRSPRLF